MVHLLPSHTVPSSSPFGLSPSPNPQKIRTNLTTISTQSYGSFPPRTSELKKIVGAELFAGLFVTVT